MRRTHSHKHTCPRAIFSLILVFSFIFTILVPFASADEEDTILDLAYYSERYLSDLAIADGGRLSLDSEGNVLFDISSASNSLRFKCTGAYSSGEQNAVCIKLNNRTDSTKLSVSIVFMDYNGDTHTKVYKKTISGKDSDSYIFIQSPENLFVTGITLSAEGVGSGSITVMGIWHCYYYFAEEVSDGNVGYVSKLEYTDNGSKVHIEGSIHHDITISSKSSTIALYRLLPGELISDEFIKEHKPCAKSEMSRSFSFTVDNITGDDYASSYALVTVSENGSLEYIIEDKLYPSHQIVLTGKSESGFKGIATSLEFLASKTYSDTLVIDVRTDIFISEKISGYLYSFCGENYCFDSEAVNNIDRRIISASSDKGNIYFRLTLSDSSSLYGVQNAVYDADGERARELYALVSFLCERYSDNIGGFIVGNKFDIPHTYQNLEGVSHGEYIRRYSDYLSIVSAALKNNISSAKVIVPLSSNNSRIYGDSASDEKYPMSATLISLIEIYSRINASSVTLMVCDDSFPDVSSLKKGNIGSRNSSEEEDFRSQSGEIMNISSENTKVFEDLILYISKTFDFVDSKYFFMWEPYGNYTRREYEIAYAYAYFNLCQNSNIYSFICDFTKDEKLGSYEKSEHMADVITAMGSEGAISFADSITKESGNFTFKGIYGYDNYSVSSGKITEISASSSLPTDALGVYHFSDLHHPSTLSNWKTGAYTEYINMASVFDGTRSVKALMTLPHYNSEFAEIVYTFDSAVSLAPVSNIVLSLMITSEDTSNEGYTVRTVIGGDDLRCVAENTVKAANGESFILSLDISEIEGLTSVRYIKICVQNNSGSDDDIITNVIAVDAYSRTMTDDQLKKAFEQAGGSQFDISDLYSGNSGKGVAIIALFCVAAFAIFAIIVYRNNALEGEENT